MRLTEKVENYTEPYERRKDIGLWDIFTKLGQLEDIEDELGVDLITLFKQPYCSIFIKKHYEPYGDKPFADIIQEHTLYAIIPQEKCILVTFENIKFYWRDYGKTWSLDKNDLTKE